MSDGEVVRGILVHYNDQHVQVRKDFFDLCAYDKSQFNQRVSDKGKVIRDEPNQECMAKILRLIETLTNSARSEWYRSAINAQSKGLHAPKEPAFYQITLAYSAICKLLYFTYGESTVRNSVAVLIQRGYIFRVRETNNSIPKYTLNVKIVQDALKKLEEEQIEKGLLNSTARTKKRGRPPKEEKLAVENNSQTSENNSQTFGSNSQTSENNTNKNTYNNPSNKPDNKCVSPANESSPKTISHTPKQNDLNPFMPEIPETPMPESIIVPERPLEQWPWGAEKALRITESLVNTTYKNDANQLRACQKILDTYNPSEEDYVGVMKKADAYYRRHQQTLYPTNLLAIDKSSGRIWFDRLYEEVMRFSQALPAEDNEYKVHTSPLVLQEEALPVQYIRDIEKLGYDFKCDGYIEDTVDSLLLVYRDTSPELFQTIFAQCLKEITPAQVKASRWEDALDYLCKEIQTRVNNTAVQQSHPPVVESN